MLQDVTSIVGALGVIVSLVFVGMQVLQANKLARVAARQEQVVATGLISRLIAEDGQLADIWTRAIAGQDITPAEQTQVVAYLMFVERMQEGLYWQYIDGEVDPELWEAHRRHARAAQAIPVVAAMWKLRGKFFSERYRTFRDAETAKAGDDRMMYDVMPAKFAAEAPPKDAEP